MRALLNGCKTGTLAAGDDLVAEYSPGGPGESSALALSRPARGWKALLRDVRPLHMSPHTSEAQGDFCWLHWAELGLVLLAGNSRFFAVDSETGSVLFSGELQFTEQS